MENPMVAAGEHYGSSGNDFRLSHTGVALKYLAVRTPTSLRAVFVKTFFFEDKLRSYTFPWNFRET